MTAGDTRLRLDGRAVLVTGAGRGIGREHALLLAARGASVMVSDVGSDLFGTGTDRAPAQETVDTIRDRGGDAACYFADLTAPDGAAGAIDAMVSAFGRVDALVHNAGFTLGGRDFADESADRLHAQLAINTDAAFALVHRAWPLMQRQQFGRVVFTASTAYYGMPRSVPYATAKSSLLGLTRSLAEAGAGDGITVNAVAPAGATRMAQNLAESDFRSWFLETMRPELVSPLVAVLVDPDAEVTGEVFVVGGGRVARTVLAETTGYVDAALSPESLRAHLPEILADRRLHFPRSMAESGALAATTLGHELAGPVSVSAGTSPASDRPIRRAT